jgi:hypothetical protein
MDTDIYGDSLVFNKMMEEQLISIGILFQKFEGLNTNSYYESEINNYFDRLKDVYTKSIVKEIISHPPVKINDIIKVEIGLRKFKIRFY